MRILSTVPTTCGLKRCITLEDGVIFRFGKTKVLEFSLNKKRGMSESLVCVFLIDSSMVFAGVFAAFQHQRHKRQELGIGVTRVMDMRGRLFLG